MPNFATERQEGYWQTKGCSEGGHWQGWGGGSIQHMKRGCGSCIFELGQREGGISLQSAATQRGVTEQAEAWPRYVAKEQAATVMSCSKGLSGELQGITVVFTVTIFRDLTERPERLGNLRLWRHSKLSRTRFEASPVLRWRLDQSFFPTQIFIWCWRKNKVAYSYNIEATAQALQRGPVMKNCPYIITANSLSE